MAAKISVLGLILSSPPYLRSAKARFLLKDIILRDVKYFWIVIITLSNLRGCGKTDNLATIHLVFIGLEDPRQEPEPEQEARRAAEGGATGRRQERRRRARQEAGGAAVRRQERRCGGPRHHMLQV